MEQQELEFNIVREMNIKRRNFTKNLLFKINHPVLMLPKPMELLLPTSEKKKRRNLKKLSPLQLKILTYKDRAESKGIEFSITDEYFQHLLHNPCTYCGEESTVIDRIDSKQGYIESNTQGCCKYCNIMKYSFPEDVFLAHIRRIYNHSC